MAARGIWRRPSGRRMSSTTSTPFCTVRVYRARYADFLRMDFPRIPPPADRALFAELARLGRELCGLHLLELQLDRYQHGLLMLDWEGCGSPEKNAGLEEESLNRQLQEKWDTRAGSIVIDPELDVWIWGSDQALAPVIDWDLSGSIRDFIASKGFELDHNLKPKRAYTMRAGVASGNTSARVSVSGSASGTAVKFRWRLWRSGAFPSWCKNSMYTENMPCRGIGFHLS